MLQAEAAFTTKDFLRAASFYAKVRPLFLALLCLCISSYVPFSIPVFSVILVRFLMDVVDIAEITLKHFGIWSYVF